MLASNFQVFSAESRKSLIQRAQLVCPTEHQVRDELCFVPSQRDAYEVPAAMHNPFDKVSYTFR